MRLLLLILLSLVAAYLGRFLFSAQDAVNVYAACAYWFLWVVVLGFLYCSARVFRADWLACQRGDACRLQVVLIGLFVVVFSTLFVARGSPVEYKTVMDEHVIASSARALHETRQLHQPVRVHELEGVRLMLTSKVDKRPPFFAFSVALLHDLFGYHPERSLHFNAYVLTPVFFTLLYLAGYRLGGAIGGACCALLMATVPLVSTACSSGGLELLNLVLLVACFLLAERFIREPCELSCGALCFGAILLAYTRYESVIYVVPVAFACGLVWWRARKVTVFRALLLSPMLLVPYLWQNQIFGLNEGHWQLEGKSAPFSMEYVWANFERSVYYFMNLDVGIPNSWLLLGLGLFGFVVLLLSVRSMLAGAQRFEASFLALLLYVFSGGLLYVLLLAYSWDFGGPLVQRLALPLYFPLSLLAVFGVRSCAQLPLLRNGLLGCLAVYILLYAYPATSLRAYEIRGASNVEYQAALELLELCAVEEDAIVVAENVFFFSLYDYSVVATQDLNARPEDLAWYLQQMNCSEVYFFEPLEYDARKGVFCTRLRHELNPLYKRELVAEKRISDVRKVQLSRIKGVSGLVVKEKVFDDTQSYLRELYRRLP